MAMLATISTSPTRPTRGQRARLTVLAGLLLALPTAAGFSTPPAAGGVGAPQPPALGGPPSLPGVVPGAPAPPAPGGSPPGGPPGAQPPAWQVFQELSKAYALSEGEMVRCIQPPFPPVRAAWLRVYAHRRLDESQVLSWNGDRLVQLFHLPPSADGYPLRDLLGRLFGVSVWDVVDDQKLLAGRKLQADFVVRWFPDRAELRSKLLDPLGQVLRRDLQVPVKLSIREVERPHLVASGTLNPPTLPGTGLLLPVVIYGKEPPPAGTPEQTVTHEELLMAVGDYVGLAVIDETNPSGNRFPGRGDRNRRDEPSRPVRVLMPSILRPSTPANGFGAAFESYRVVVRGDRKSEGVDTEAVLKRVAGQTGLTLRVEPRRVPALVVEKAE
jgi:hypothetical protein